MLINMVVKLIILSVLMGVQINAMSQISEKIKNEVRNQSDFAISLCKYLHSHPELSFQEFETAKKLSAELRKNGFEVTDNFGGNNVVGILRNGDGPVIMLRTDMDALPVEEKTGLEYASTKISTDSKGNPEPVMHACGTTFICLSVWVRFDHLRY